MKRIETLLLIVIAIFLSAPNANAQFASKKQLQACQDENKQLQESLNKVREELAASKVNVESLTSQLENSQKEKAELQKSLNSSITGAGQNNAQMEKLVNQLNESNLYIRKLMADKVTTDSLNLALTKTLTDSLSKEELRAINIVAAKGNITVAIADNFLYNIGTNEVSEKADAAFAKMAKVLNANVAYAILVEGNTDNKDLSDAEIKDSWSLASARAISVVKLLHTKYGIDPKRLTAGARGEYNPIASNDTEAGQQRNRRTQIILTLTETDSSEK